MACDLFADADLTALCPTQPMPLKDYPWGFQRPLLDQPTIDWMYLGGLENHPELLESVTEERRQRVGDGAGRLLGNSANVVRQCRSPEMLDAVLRAIDLSLPTWTREPPVTANGQRWLFKADRSAGGLSVRRWDGSPPTIQPGYWQIEKTGGLRSAVFFGHSDGAWLWGATTQLAGWPAAGAQEFWHVGNIGPIALRSTIREQLERVGSALVQQIGLTGIFGIDFIEDDDRVWPLEVNPRPPASAEVLERATARNAYALHRSAVVGPWQTLPPTVLTHCWGRAVYYAPQRCRLRPSWRDAGDVGIQFADLPHPDVVFERGQPILTVLAPAASIDQVEASLQRALQELTRVGISAAGL